MDYILIVLTENVNVPIWAFLLVGLGAPSSSIFNTWMGHRAASKAAALVANVKTHLERTEKKTDGKLDKIHVLVNNNLSEVLKQKLYMAELLIDLQPNNEKFQLLHTQCLNDVNAHAKADSSKLES